MIFAEILTWSHKTCDGLFCQELPICGTDSVYYTSKIYDYIFENIHSLPVIDTNKRRDIVN